MKPVSLTGASAAVAAVLLAPVPISRITADKRALPHRLMSRRARQQVTATSSASRSCRKTPPNVAGTVIGGIVGGLIGHQIGGGTGQTAATIAGAVGGAVAGNQIEKRSRAANETFRVTVRLDNGGYQTVTQDNITDLRTGDRVRVDGNRVYRY